MQTDEHPKTAYLYQNIRRLCKERGMTIAEVERKTCLGNGVIRKWNSASPTLRTVIAVSECLGVTLDELLKVPETRE